MPVAVDALPRETASWPINCTLDSLRPVDTHGHLVAVKGMSRQKQAK